MRLSSSLGFQRSGGVSNAQITPGIVMLWPNSDAPPDTWVKCNGTNGTVDMRGYHPRGTPVSDTINRVYGSASHTHSAAHSHTGEATGTHTHSVAQHTHTACHYHSIVSNHCHTLTGHTHATTHQHDWNHRHGYSNYHCHGGDLHRHDQDHCHTGSGAYVPGFYFPPMFGYTHEIGNSGIGSAYVLVKAFVSSGFQAINAAGSGYGGYFSPYITHAGASTYLGGTTGTILSSGGGEEYTQDSAFTVQYCTPGSYTDYSAADTDYSATPSGSASPDTDYADVPDSSNATPSAQLAGAIATGATQPSSLTVDSCALVTDSAAGTPPTRNVEYIMKL